MHVEPFLHKTLAFVMSKKRLDTLTLLVQTAIVTKTLSVTALGRGMDLPIQERSGIRRADRFLSNAKLYEEKREITQELIALLIGGKKCCDVIVDWTGVPNTFHHVLRASLVTQGRALTLYEEVHAQEQLENRHVHRDFLKALKEVLPPHCKPTLITDGGFHNEWFKDVLRCGWDYIGRIRVGSGKKVQVQGERIWTRCGELCQKATGTPRWVGKYVVGKTNPLETDLYLYKGALKGRTSLNRWGKKRQGGNERDYREWAYEPWLLATSLSGKSYLMAKRVIKKYQTRMQIEEGIRDLKSTRYGLSFEQAHSKKRERIAILLLIAQLASVIAWLTGWIGEQRKLQVKFQSNSTRDRRVLSLFFLGCQMIRRGITITLDELEIAIKRGIRDA